MKKLIMRWAPAVLALLMVACSSQGEGIDYAEGIHDIPDLNGKKISTLSGSMQELTIDDLCPDATVLRLNSTAEVMTAVENGQADYFIVDTTALIGAHIEQRGMQVVFQTDRISGDCGFGFQYKDSALCRELNTFLKRFREDGRWDSIVNYWFYGDIDHAEMKHPQLDPNGPTLRVGTNAYCPFSMMLNGRYAGFEMEIIEAFCAETGRNVEYLTIDFNGIIAALVTGKIDMISSSMFITEERAKQVLFSDSYCHSGSVCVCRSSEKVAKKPFGESVKESFHNNLMEDNRWKIIVDGLWETVIISVLAILFGTLFGCFICWLRLSRNGLMRGVAQVYVELIRGVPILVLLMLMFYVIFAQSAISARSVAIIAFAMNFGAYVSEMFRSGIEAIDKGQTEAGLAMGFTPLKTFFYFIVPQAAKRVIPVFKGEAVSLFKNTSVVGFIAIQDLTKASEIIRARTFDAFFPLIVISIIYFILAWLFGKLLDCLAKKIA